MAEKEAAAQREVGDLQEQVAQLQAQLQALQAHEEGAPTAVGIETTVAVV